jgi:peptidoglycan/xylan/chitin deacetylase (PgdA/CDA1 family)
MFFLPADSRLQGYIQRHSAALLFRRPLVIQAGRPIVSFTFDDFPRSALFEGGAILRQFGVSGTYYASFGLMDRDAPTGRIFGRRDLRTLIDEGHELGCHTYAHCHSWDTSTKVFERSVEDNRRALAQLLPGVSFRTLAYPISAPRPGTKLRMASHFVACRGGGQTMNAGTTDLNQLAAFFLEKTAPDLRPVRDLIDRNRDARGWLILATHDVTEKPTPFGCTPEFFEAVVSYAVRSGADVMTVGAALDALATRAV